MVFSPYFLVVIPSSLSFNYDTYLNDKYPTCFCIWYISENKPSFRNLPIYISKMKQEHKRIVCNIVNKLSPSSHCIQSQGHSNCLSSKIS
ncbi:hypothetical protein C1646_694517 [Rhizophagus diaphanus]|nr:hypothetical protein C1646_694517 [Rhizophagus diaphanus] [Rhizophagus sp. MUCL 43196]